MTARLDTPEGKALYKQRSAIIELVFAQLFARMGRHLSYRDTRVDLEHTGDPTGTITWARTRSASPTS